jgi:hypothetical protein
MPAPHAIDLRESDDRLVTPMIPGARESVIPTPFGLHSVVVLPVGPSTMDAATIAMHQKEGGGGPAQRRHARQQLWWGVLARRMLGLLTFRPR